MADDNKVSRPLSPPPPRSATDKQFRTKPLSRVAQLAIQEIQSAAAQRADTIVAAEMEDRELTNQTPPWTFDARSMMFRQEILPEEKPSVPLAPAPDIAPKK